MPVNQEMSTVVRVEPRDIWPHEAQDFTPWLAHNISKLGEALGLDIEAQSQEAPVGGYSLDILALEVGRGRPVIIESCKPQTTPISGNCSHMQRGMTEGWSCG